MSLLNTKVLPTLKGAYVANVKSYEEIENDKGGYVKVILVLPEQDNREYTYCIFPTQVDYVTSALRTQAELQDEEVTLAEMLEYAKKNQITVWFSYNQDIGRMNVAFHESKTVIEDAVEL